MSAPLFPLADALPEPDPDAVAFFREHAGYGYNPETETPEQGQNRNARKLAQAEAEANRRGWTVEWCDDWEVGSHRAFYGEAYDDGEPETCEGATLTDESGDVLASLWCIDGATDDYRRVVAAELASEALARAGAR